MKKNEQLLNNFTISAYLLLGVATLITLVPFVWLFFASIRSSDVYFDFQFIPRNQIVSVNDQALTDDNADLYKTVAKFDGELLDTMEANLDDRIITLAENDDLYSIELGGIAWRHLTLDHFKTLLNNPNFLFARNVLNSLFYASVTAVFATLFSAMGGYALAKFQFRFRDLFTKIVLLSLIIPGALLLAPGYQLLFNLGLLDSYFGLILPGLAPAFGVFLFRQSMLNSIPLELMEAARIDGCGEIRLFFTIILPLSRPMIGAFLMITFLGAWNNFIGPQIILQTPSKFPLAVAIAQLRGIYSTEYGLIMAGTILSIAPVMALFLLLQKEFISGLTSGAVKG